MLALFPSPPVAETSYQGCEGCVFDFSDSLFVGPLLDAFMFSIGEGLHSACLFDGARGLNTRTLKYVRSNVPPQKPFATVSSRVPSCLLTDAPFRSLCVTSCNSGSVHTS